MATEQYYYAERQCRELRAQIAGPWQDCMSRYELFYNVWEFVETAIPIAFGVFMVGFLIHQFRGDIENAFVDGIAGLIKGKRRFSQNVSDTKTRIAEKIDKAANE